MMGLLILLVIAGVLVLAVGAVAAHRIRIPAPFWVLGFALVWYLTVLSGLSTSLTAVAFAMIVPIKGRAEDGQSPLKEAMHDLHPWNAFLVLPLFAFANAGVALGGMGQAIGEPVVVANSEGSRTTPSARAAKVSAIAAHEAVLPTTKLHPAR